jgi:hypothetical protein
MSRPRSSTGVRQIVRSAPDPPWTAFLDAWAARDWHDGLRLDTLEPLQQVRIWTRNSVYDVITSDTTGEVRVRGGRHFAEWTTVQFAGSSAGGSVLRRFAIHVGLRLEFAAACRRVTTSRVEAFSILPGATTV